MSQIKGLMELVQSAIDQGATSVEEVHQKFASLPFKMYKNIRLLDESLVGVQEMQHQTIGMVYQTIRAMNQQVAAIAMEMLRKMEK